MQATKGRASFVIVAIFGAVILSAVIVLGAMLLSGAREPKYEGIGLSRWADGTMARQRGPMPMLKVLQSVGPEALPWLVEEAGRQGTLRHRLYLLYVKVYISSSLAQRLLPRPGPDISSTRQENVFGLLARLAPGTSYEERAVRALLAVPPKPPVFETRFRLLGSFTNYPRLVLPALLPGLNHPSTVDAAVSAFERFGTSATPVLYPKALIESGFIRPAELALKKADPVAYEKLREKKL